VPDRWQLDMAALAASTASPGASDAPATAPTELRLEEQDAPATPFDLFGRWLDEAFAAGLLWPHVTVLATATADGIPSARTVMLERFDPSGFVFHTNLNSPKSQDLAKNPRAALVFLWSALGRQVRIDGGVVPASRAETEAYFQGSPRGIQVMLNACANQSDIIPSRAALEAVYAEALARFAAGPVPIPPHLGGLRIVPETFEFFQARPNNLQDRLRYTRGGASWRLERLVP